MLNRYLAFVFLVGGATLTSIPADAADISEISAQEFFAATYFRNALSHPQLAAQKSRKRQIRMVARDIRWKPKRLTQAIGKLDALDGDPLALAKEAVMTALNKTRVKGRILDVIVNADEPKHVVMYVRWRGSRRKNAIKEAATIAAAVGEATPLVSTLSLAAIHPKAPDTSTRSVWQAKIASSAMTNIRKNRIEDYADRLYARLFEDLKAFPF
ncbi:MAG: hypothetical protein AAF449_10775 [Myxococcota bacterium]